MSESQPQLPGPVPPTFGGEVFEIRLLALRSGVPSEQRLKQALKALLRQWRFRCLDLRRIGPKGGEG